MRMSRTRAESAAPPPGRGVVISITPRTIWLAVGLIALLAAVAIILMKAMFVLMLLFIAIIFAEGIRHLVDFQERHRMPRPLGVFIVYFAILLVIALLGFLLIQPIMHQITRLNSDLPGYVSRVQASMTHLDQTISNNPLLSKSVGSPSSSIGDLARRLAPLLLQLPFLLGRCFSVSSPSSSWRSSG